MKRLLLVTTSALLVLPDIAMAQATTRPVPGQERPVGRPQVQPPKPNPGQNVRPPRPNPGQGVRPPRPNPGGPSIQPPRPNPGGPSIQPPRPGPGQGVRPPRPRPPHRPGYRPPHFRPIHGPVFHYPRGWRYRRWSIGLLLPSLFLSSAYYYDNYYNFGFGPPPHGYRWVRYGPDLLLVNIRTRRIADVIYGAFR
nr:RcnB family protein [uncultured Sphingomonas sp.]